MTIALNLLLLFLLVWRQTYMEHPFLNFLVFFNVICSPVMWYVHDHMSRLYPHLYYGKMYAMFFLWFAVTVEAWMMGRRKVAIPIEIYAFTKMSMLFVSNGILIYWVSQGLRLFNIAALCYWLYLFIPKENEDA